MKSSVPGFLEVCGHKWLYFKTVTQTLPLDIGAMRTDKHALEEGSVPP